MSLCREDDAIKASVFTEFHLTEKSVFQNAVSMRISVLNHSEFLFLKYNFMAFQNMKWLIVTHRGNLCFNYGLHHILVIIAL